MFLVMSSILRGPAVISSTHMSYRTYTRYDTLEEFNVNSKAEY